MDNLDFLDGDEPVSEAVPVETPVVEEAPVAETPPAEEAKPEAEPRPRGPDGKFAKKDDPVMVPLTALHETRDELKQLKAELERLRQPQEQPKAPDVFDDPEGFTGHIQKQIEQATLNATLNLSEEITRANVGDDVVNAAQEWGQQQFAAKPELFREFAAQRNPYGYLVQLYQREQSYSKLGDPKEIEAYLAWKQAQSAIPTQQAAPPPSAPSPSIASAPSAGGLQTVATGPGVAFDEIFRN